LRDLGSAVRAREGVGDFVAEVGHGNYSKGVSDVATEMSEPMIALVQANSRALG
jgi:hypothetical protein